MPASYPEGICNLKKLAAAVIPAPLFQALIGQSLQLLCLDVPAEASAIVTEKLNCKPSAADDIFDPFNDAFLIGQMYMLKGKTSSIRPKIIIVIINENILILIRVKDNSLIVLNQNPNAIS